VALADKGVNVVALTTTWHSGSDDVCLRLATPAGYAVVDAARTSASGGGIAIIFRKHLKCSRLAVPACYTLETICVLLTMHSRPVIVVHIYLPGSEKLSALFSDEMASILEMLVSYLCPVVVGGNFNVRSQDLTLENWMPVTADELEMPIGSAHRVRPVSLTRCQHGSSRT